MARDEGRVLGNREAGFAFQHTHGSERDRHQRRLGIFRQLQGLAWTVPDDVRQLLTERRIDLVEYRPRRRKSLRQRLAHTDRLGTLPRKGECCRHTCPRTFLRRHTQRQASRNILIFQYLTEILKPPWRAKPPLAPARPPKDTAGAFPVKQ